MVDIVRARELRNQAIDLAWRLFHVKVACALREGMLQRDIAIQCNVTRETVRQWAIKGGLKSDA